MKSWPKDFERAYAALDPKHGGDHGNQYTVEVASSEPQNLAEPKAIEVVAEETGVTSPPSSDLT